MQLLFKLTGSVSACSELLGVLGVDAVLDDMEAALLDEQFGLSYAFLITKLGKAIIHPRLKPSAEVSAHCQNVDQACNYQRQFVCIATRRFCSIGH